MASDGHLALRSSRQHANCIYKVPLLRSSPNLGKVLHENQSNLHFDPQLHGSWVDMNIINGIARGWYSICELVPPSLAPEEQTLRERSEHCVRGANTVWEERLWTWHVLNVCKCVLLGKDFGAYKGLIIMKKEMNKQNTVKEINTHYGRQGTIIVIHLCLLHLQTCHIITVINFHRWSPFASMDAIYSPVLLCSLPSSMPCMYGAFALVDIHILPEFS